MGYKVIIMFFFIIHYVRILIILFIDYITFIFNLHHSYTLPIFLWTVTSKVKHTINIHKDVPEKGYAL